jgi:LuxR family maltose regulon positive regulatory protein
MQQPDAAAVTMERLLDFAREMNDAQCLSVAHSCAARLSLLRGKLTPSELVWSINETPAPSALFVWLEVPSITQARVLIADGSEESLGKATRLLREIRHQSEACRFACQTLEVATLQSLALKKQGRGYEALEALKEAVALAGAGGWIRPFVELGLPMAEMLLRLQNQNVAVDYIEKLLGAFQELQVEAPTQVQNTKSAIQILKSNQPTQWRTRIQNPIIEPLTHRELDVLELLSARLQNKEIAEKLVISPTTVKTHLQNIYQKLYVKNRRQAVERARTLGVL